MQSIIYKILTQEGEKIDTSNFNYFCNTPGGNNERQHEGK